MIKGHNKQPFRYRGKEFIFRGMIRCAHCGCLFCSEQKKGQYIYLRPTKSKGPCECKTLREVDVLAEIESLFGRMAMPDDVLKQLQRTLKESAKEQQDQHSNAITHLQREYTMTQKRLDSLLDVRLEGSITRDEYDRKASELKQRQNEITVQLEDYTRADKDFAKALSDLLEVGSNAKELFKSSEIAQKRALINFILPNLEVNAGTLDYSIRSPFREVMNMRESKKWLRG